MATVTAPSVDAFRARVDDLVARHPVVADNRYTQWFADRRRHPRRGAPPHRAVLRVQPPLRRGPAAQGHQRRRPRHVPRRQGDPPQRARRGVQRRPPPSATVGTDPELVATEGTVDGGRFRFGAAHFEWLLRFASPLGLGFDDIGKRRHGTAPTLYFCDELLEVYGAEDASVAEGASYAVEHWAAAGFWKELIAGLEAFKARECDGLPLAFWTWHDKVEDQHAAHTDDELVEAYAQPWFDEERFLAGATRMLDGVQAFWDGLWADHEAGVER